jgi:ribosomal protein L40E
MEDVPFNVTVMKCSICGAPVAVKFGGLKHIEDVGFSTVVCRPCYEKVPEGERFMWRTKKDAYVGEVYRKPEPPKVGDKNGDGWIYRICPGCNTLQPVPPKATLCHSCYLGDLIADTKALTASIKKGRK